MNRIKTQKLFRLFLAATVISGVAVSFQNCGKAGFNGDGGLDETVGASGDPALKAAPLPIDAGFTQIAYMSCPQAGTNSGSTDTLDTPYFTLRFGAYDNSTGFTFSGGPKGGVGMSEKAIEHIKRQYPTLPPEALSNYIKNHPATANSSLAAAVIMRDRSPDYLAVAPVATTMLDTLSTPHMSSAIGSGEVVTGSGTTKRSFFPQASSGRRAVVGSLNFGASEMDVEQFREDLKNNHYLFLGLVDDSLSRDGASIISNLESPDDDVTKRLYGKGYELFFEQRSTGGDVNLHYPRLRKVVEVDINPSNYSGGAVNPTDLSAAEAHNWDCFSLTIVRDTDRKYYTTTSSITLSGYTTLEAGTPIPPRELGSGKYGALKEHYFQTDSAKSSCSNANNRDFQDQCGVADVMELWNRSGTYFKDSLGGVPLGVLKACPSQRIENVTGGVDYQGRSQMDLLKIARRFLPADQWDINLDYNCAVPKAKVTNSRAKCYASGDKELNYYVQYDTTSLPCGQGKNECASFVSICYRKK
ncbi:MAG: hypothetical protein BroJett040_10460 [Oligoflexia bacterium]|nr:MAG: hypothetical protein BroJett040_10460 [Oligoflexia bacterium]